LKSVNTADVRQRKRFANFSRSSQIRNGCKRRRIHSPVSIGEANMSMEQILKARQERIDTLHETRRDRTALLVIDMQRGFLKPGAALEVPPGRELIPRIKRLIECCRKISVSVIFTEFAYSSALPCLRGDPFGPQNLPSEPGKSTGFGYPSGKSRLRR
jgi:hypothetical protein